jgi:type II secretory pathway pseudopilin PulG
MSIYKKKKKSRHSNDGFTLIEVVIAALILMAFVAISAQSILLANFTRIKAQERARANQAIQEDVETLRLIGANDNNVAVPVQWSVGTCAATTATTGYANSLLTNFITLKSSYITNYNATSFASENVSFSGNTLSYQLRVRRQVEPAVANDPNFKVLRIRYRVETTKRPAAALTTDCNYGNNCVLDDYIEVIPNVAFRCP